jgi:hypothetical protein
MIISHKHRFIFLKTRKTAGTSIEIALSRFCGEEDIITPIGREDKLRENLSPRGAQNFQYAPEGKHTSQAERQISYYNHIPARRVRALIGTEIWDEYFKFCIERNPWDKAISMYYWRTRKREPQPLSLLEFLRSENDKHEMPEGRGSKLSNFRIYSIGRNVAVDHVGLYENLNSELEQIADLLNLPEEIELPRIRGAHREDRRHYREIMGHEERDIVARICAREIALFGYSF